MAGDKRIKDRFFNAVETVLGRVGTTINCSDDEQAFARNVLRVAQDGLALIHYGIDFQTFQPADMDEKRALRKKLGLPLDTALLVSVGRDSFQKHYAPIYRALEDLLRDSGHGLAFAHAGAGSGRLASKLDERARRHVFSFEYLARPADLVRAADAFILTSRYEGLSIAALEALGAGLRMFLTKAPGSACLEKLDFDIIWLEPDGSSGRGLPDMITHALREWVRNHRAATWAGRDAQVLRARRLFDKQTQFHAVFRLYQDMLERSQCLTTLKCNHQPLH
jgi:glycosyltransferase involved in cell wall biosynthesis